MADWQEWPQRLWGDDWIAPMSEVLNINRRTIERWRAGEGEPNIGLQTELRRLALRYGARAIGNVLRRMARGETLKEIKADIREHQIATTRIEVELGKYGSIPILASRNTDALLDD